MSYQIHTHNDNHSLIDLNIHNDNNIHNYNHIHNDLNTQNDIHNYTISYNVILRRKPTNTQSIPLLI